MQQRLWAQHAREQLELGETVEIHPLGDSMKGRIESGAMVTLAPCAPDELAAGDIVLARVKGRRYFHLVLHLIVAREEDRFLIGNNFGRTDGWVGAEAIFGKVVKIVRPPTQVARG